MVDLRARPDHRLAVMLVAKVWDAHAGIVRSIRGSRLEGLESDSVTPIVDTTPPIVRGDQGNEKRRDDVMDPNLFHIDWERTLEAIVGIIILAFLVERFAALVFESRWFVYNTKIPDEGSREAAREQAGVDAASKIVDAAHAGRSFASVVNKLNPTIPLWPPNPDDAKMADRAEAYLAQVTRINARRRRLSRLPVKELGAFLLGASVCIAFNFDALSIILLAEQTTWWGAVLTGAVVAGGSKASIKLFHDLLGVKSQAVREMRKAKEGE